MRSAPSDRLGLSVWVRLMRAHGLILRQARRSVGPELTLPRFDVLVQICGSPDGLTFGEMSRRLLVTAGNLTGIVNRLESEGLVKREAHETDGRATRVRPTVSGRHLMRRLMPRHARDIESMLSDVPRADLQKLRTLLGHLLQNVPRHKGHEKTASPTTKEAR